MHGLHCEHSLPYDQKFQIKAHAKKKPYRFSQNPLCLSTCLCTVHFNIQHKQKIKTLRTDKF